MRLGQDDQAVDSTAQKALSGRALLTGFLLVVVFALLAPINDWLLHNTFLYSQYLPVGVFLLLVTLGVVVNPLLGSRRFRANELMTMTAMLLVLGGVVSSGLNAYFPAVVAGPAKLLGSSSELAAFVDDAGVVQLPKGAYVGIPHQGVPDANEPEYRLVIDGFHSGMGAPPEAIVHRSTVTWREGDGVAQTRVAMTGRSDDAQILDLDSPLGQALLGQRAGAVIAGPTTEITVIAVSAPTIPWGVWTSALLTWAPLLASAMVCFLCIAALVRHQWMHNERLPYPIAEVISGFLQDPEPGHRFAPVFLTKAFQITFVIVALVLIAKGLHAMGLLPFAIPTEISVWRALDFAPFNRGYSPNWMYLTPTLYFSIICLTFFLSTDLSFSLWFCFIAGNLVYAFVGMQGVAVSPSMAARVSMGGWFVECILILWVGRSYFLRLLRTAFARTDDPHLREMRPFTWAFLASACGMVLAMVAFGAEWGSAVVAALCYLGVGLVLARLVAEAGIPFMQTPMMCSTVIYSLTGLAAPMAALVPLTMLGQTLSADTREHLLPFATNAEYLASKAGVPRMRWAVVALLVVGVGTLLSGAVMLWCGYAYAGQQGLDSWWKSGPLLSSLGPVANHAVGGSAVEGSSTYASYGLGAFLTGALGIARLAWSWWPIHPIGILVCATTPMAKIWFSIFLGWLIKVLVMRYGGVQLYKRLKPAAMGGIAAEAAVVGGFLVLGLLAAYFGQPLPQVPRFLPG